MDDLNDRRNQNSSKNNQNRRTGPPPVEKAKKQKEEEAKSRKQAENNRVERPKKAPPAAYEPQPPTLLDSLYQVSVPIGAPRRGVLSGLQRLGELTGLAEEQPGSSVLPLMLGLAGLAAGLPPVFNLGLKAIPKLASTLFKLNVPSLTSPALAPTVDFAQRMAPRLGAVLGTGVPQLLREAKNPDAAVDVLDYFPDSPLTATVAGLLLDPLLHLVPVSLTGSAAKKAILDNRLSRLPEQAVYTGKGLIAPPTPRWKSQSPQNVPMAHATPPPNVSAPTSVLSPDPLPAPVISPPAPQIDDYFGYTPEQLATVVGGSRPIIGERPDLRLAGYRRANERIADLFEPLGLTTPSGEIARPLPPWAEMRGGRVMPVAGYEGAIDHLRDLAGINPFNHESRMRMLERLRSLDKAEQEAINLFWNSMQ